MKIAVIGAGIVGMCTAYELALDGHAVSIFERNASVAEEASFACGGHLSTSLAHPQSFPARPKESGLRRLLAASSISAPLGTSLRDLRWLLAWKSDSRDFEQRFASAQALASYSLQRLHALAAQAHLVYEQSQGQLLLFASEAQQAAYQPQQKALSALGVLSRALTPEQARVLEPALSADLPLHGALVFPHDEIGNCRQFAHLLKDKLLSSGAQFHFGTTVIGLAAGARVALELQGMPSLDFEQVVVCAGTGATALLGKQLRRGALAKVWSSSVSAPIREPLNAPHSAVMDYQSQLAIGRMGTRVRASGGAALGQASPKGIEQASQRLFQILQSHFPGAADYSRGVQIWQGSSIFSADALPLVGPADASGVWLNLAHGHNGWSLACGAARVIADQIAGRAPEVDSTLLQPGRFKS